MSAGIVALACWLALGVVVIAAISWLKWLVGDGSGHSARMRQVAAAIDDGEPCRCCDAVWYEVDEVVSIDGGEVRTRTTLNMDHDDWCSYAEWAGL